MKVLFAYRYLTMGGVETLIRARLEHLAQHGVEAWAWFLNDGKGMEMFSSFQDRVLVGWPNTISIAKGDKPFDLATTFDTPEVFESLAEQSIPTFLESHSPYRENLMYLKSLNKGQIQGILTPTNYQRSVVEEYVNIKVRVEVVPNALGSGFFEPISPFIPTPGKKIIAWVGRLDWLKNWMGFLKLCKELKAIRDDVEFLLVGDFPSKEDWSRLYLKAEKEGVIDKLRWFTSVPVDSMPSLLDYVRDSGGVLVSTSRGESFGLSAAEAMCRACPVLVPDRLPFTEFIVDGQTGLTSDYKHYSKAAQKLHQLLSNKDHLEKLGSNGRQHMFEHYSPAVTSKRLLEIFKEHSE